MPFSRSQLRTYQVLVLTWKISKCVRCSLSPYIWHRDILILDAAPLAGGEIVNDIIATRVPDAVVPPHGKNKNSFALEDGVATRESYNGKEARLDIESVGEHSASAMDKEEDYYVLPTEDESKNLRKIADSIPGTAWLLCIVELAERASYYGVQTVFSNFMQFPLPKGGNGAGAVGSPNQTAGALGKGLVFSNAFVLLFSFLA